MATVDPDEDRVRRFVALQHRYDEQRREWRDVVLNGFDDKCELLAPDGQRPIPDQESA